MATALGTYTLKLPYLLTTDATNELTRYSLELWSNRCRLPVKGYWLRSEILNSVLKIEIKLRKFLLRHTVVTSTEALGTCERLAQGRYSAMRRPEIELLIASPRP